MGERKGVNKYYPPDYDPNKGGLNKFQGTHALRERARKLHLGILIIRFEMPYNIWCEGCNNHIGTGVRYNAEKKKVGMYYSTPVYQFRMKCHLCDNHFEIKTDPANLDYEIVSGARRQERRWDPTENEQVVPEDKEVTRKMAVDAMYKLEHGVGDKTKAKEVDPVLKELEEFQATRWHDDYSSNQALRARMRKKREEAKSLAEKDSALNLSVPLLPPTAEDAKIAKLLQFTQSKSSEQLRKEKRAIIDARSVFTKLKTKKISQKTKKAVARQQLHSIMSHSQKTFSNFKNPYGGPTLGIIHKKSTLERESKPKNESESLSELEKESERSEKELESVSTSGIESEVSDMESEGTSTSTNINGSQEGSSSEVLAVEKQSSSSEATGSTKNTSLVSYDMSTSDSDDAS
ncbi:coiled-coil domain-containing protein 130 homolog [Portunus trituberculatus]|uniref:coiled-coil domain-containing protein 130 homolog n=1 Tax=Portunus trituberculatus TaxID=210409 RepID=UPI001E1CB996|nr:coiled-coil domain-containing protein 130 homolog [Portunus trituberculatus]